MRYAYFPGCSLDKNAAAYDQSFKAVIRILAQELVELDDWNCCGASEYFSLSPLPAYAATTLMTRKSVFDRYGWFDTEQDFGQTVEWVLRVKSGGAIVDHISDVLARRRIHKSNRSRTQDAKARDDVLQILKSHLDRQRSK